MSNPPDWYPDPLEPNRLRWWDGESWTNRLADATEEDNLPITDYRNHGKIKTNVASFRMENSKNSPSIILNEAAVKPEQKTSVDEEVEPQEQHTLSKTQNKFTSSLQALSTKKKILLSACLALSVLISGSIFYSIYQQEKELSKPSTTEMSTVLTVISSSPNIVESRVEYEEGRVCEEGIENCADYRVTAAGSSAFTAENFESLVRAISLIKQSRSDIQICLSDYTLNDSKYTPEEYAVIMNSSQVAFKPISISDNAACITYTSEDMANIP